MVLRGDGGMNDPRETGLVTLVLGAVVLVFVYLVLRSALGLLKGIMP